jgi:predicted PurR-regulated permease PerM
MVRSSSRDWPPSALIAARLVIFSAVCAALYFGQAVLIPLVLAALLTFLLSPLVSGLDRLHLPRVVSVLLVLTLVSGALGGLGYVVTGQLQTFATELPAHRSNIRAKLRDLTDLMRGRAIENVQATLEDITQAVEANGAAGDAPSEEPTPVVVEREPALGGSLLNSVLGAAGTLGLTVLLAMFMLVHREDLRNRVVSLAGRASLAVTTKAFADAGERISRFLLMQFVINATMGVAVGIGLYVIGVPYAALFGLAAGLLRYVPYVGPWVAALLPITVSLVTSPGWEQTLIVVGMFVVLELLSNNVMEPLLYGHSVGLSALAVIVAAIFWTWLWGGVGLVIATPITACLVVLASYVPELDAIGRLLGERPALPPHVSLYQRLLAQDVDEADEIVERYAAEHAPEEVCELLLNTLLALKRDLHADRVSIEDGDFVCERLRESIEELPPPDVEPEVRAANVSPVLILGVPVRDRLDEVALELARALLRGEPARFEILAPDLMIGEIVAAADKLQPAAIVLPSLPPGGLAPARHLCKRLRGRLGGGIKLLAVRLGDSAEDAARRVPQLEAAGCAEVATSLLDAANKLKIIARAEARQALHKTAGSGTALATATHGS